MQKRTVRARIVLLTLVAISSIGAAANWTWLKRSAVSEFQQADWDMLTTAARQALSTSADGETSTWRNDATHNGGAISPIRTFRIASFDCRRTRFRQEARSGRVGEAIYNVCREGEDGQWQLMSDSEIDRIRAEQ